MYCFAKGRLRSIIAVALVIAVGLPTRLAPEVMPAFMVNYGGDVLWALMIFLLFNILLPTPKTRQIALLALAVTWGIEFSQLYQADWINTIRNVKIGGLILGYTFLWSDLLCYVGGIAVGVLLEKYVLQTSKQMKIGEEQS